MCHSGSPWHLVFSTLTSSLSSMARCLGEGEGTAGVGWGGTLRPAVVLAGVAGLDTVDGAGLAAGEEEAMGAGVLSMSGYPEPLKS